MVIHVDLMQLQFKGHQLGCSQARPLNSAFLQQRSAMTFAAPG